MKNNDVVYPKTLNLGDVVLELERTLVHVQSTIHTLKTMENYPFWARQTLLNDQTIHVLSYLEKAMTEALQQLKLKNVDFVHYHHAL